MRFEPGASRDAMPTLARGLSSGQKLSDLLNRHREIRVCHEAKSALSSEHTRADGVALAGLRQVDQAQLGHGVHPLPHDFRGGIAAVILDDDHFCFKGQG